MITVILGTAHRRREPGKQSPDGRLKEYIYSREIIADLKPKLESYGIPTYIDLTDEDLPQAMQSEDLTKERSRELSMRVNEVNSLCDRFGSQNCLYISIHVNASSNDNQWHTHNGWQVCVSPNASKNSRTFADIILDTAKAHGLKTRQPLPNQKYWEQSLYVLNKTWCPAVLTENLFQDNKADTDYLLSEEGRHTIERLHIESILKYIETHKTH